MNSVFPAFEEFSENFNAGRTQLVWTWVPADLETPLSAYLKLTQDQKHSFLFESVEGGKTMGRYSIIGFDPDVVWEYSAGSDDNALGTIRKMLSDSKIDVIAENMPPMASSGLFGYMGYDMVRLAEDIPDKNPDIINIPGSILMRPTAIVVFDNVKNRMCVSVPVRETTGNLDDAYAKATRRLEKLIDLLANPVPTTALHHATELPETPQPSESMTKDSFFSMVDKAIEYIRAGEIFQVVLGLNFKLKFDLPGLSLYRSLRRTNPSPFLFYMNYGGFQLVGSSPEILVRVREGRVTIRPIAGTRKRGANEAEDKALEQDLLSDPKERSEHLMLLDLGRNDVGRVAKTGTVKVTNQFFIERYSHVMHIVSNVEGELRDDLDSLDALFAGFPAGTVSGAPKVRAMEIIDELEPTKRSYYGGCVGYISGNGEMDTCIALRTSVVKDGHIYVQASAGIVADSVAESEYQECVNKSRAILSAGQAAIADALAMRAQRR
jgi:anthranilate synthase component 1